MIEVIAVADAERDLLAAWTQFEELRPGLGAKFDAAFTKAVTQIARFPESAPVWRGSRFRRLYVRDFRVGIFYAIHGTRAIIRAVLDLRQSEYAIRRRLQE